MTKIAELLAAGPTTSFEFAPPRDDEQSRRLEKVLQELEPLDPAFVSVTYGAGGSTRAATQEIVRHIHAGTSMTVMPHLTCVAQTRADIAGLVGAYGEAGIENLLALAGDVPAGGSADLPSDFSHAVELIELARTTGDFSIGVAAFPEGHPRSTDLATDRRYLAEKLRAADFGITQFFFRADDYFRMVDDLAALGVDKPVLPGLMLFVNVDGLRRMAGLNNTQLPASLQRRLDAVAGDFRSVRDLAVEVAGELGHELLDRGAPGLHLYTMNYSSATRLVHGQLGLAPG